MSRFLSSLGISCGHESIFGFGDWRTARKRILGERSLGLSDVSQEDMITGEKLDSWFDCESMVAESSYMAAPFLHHPLISSISVIHIVRDPLKVISSFVRDFGYFSSPRRCKRDPYQTFIYDHLPKLSDYEDPMNAAAYFYLEWNRMIELQANTNNRRYLIQKVENMPSTEVLRFIKKSCPEKFFDDTKINSHKRCQRVALTLDDIPNKKLRGALRMFMLSHEYIT